MENRTKNPPPPPASEGEGSGKAIQRWSAARKREIVLRLLHGEPLEALIEARNLVENGFEEMIAGWRP